MQHASAFHGGAFWEALGHGFEHIDRRFSIISADVLDAWFPPSPRVIEALSCGADWICQTSPPAASDGLRAAISEARGIPAQNLVLGAGSSDLIFRALIELLKPDSRALILKPMYGEYAHVLEQVIGCNVRRFELHEADDYRLDSDGFVTVAGSEWFDLAVIVNPNSPTGQFVAKRDLVRMLAGISRETLVWVDEAYIDYVEPSESLERLVIDYPNLIVCKTMSKAYALSGLRVGYLAAPAELAARLNRRAPPWIVSLPAQIASCAALADPSYYHGRYLETRDLRKDLTAGLRAIGGQVIEGVANSVLWMPDEDLPCVADILSLCAESGLYLRDTGSMGTHDRCIRVAVKDEAANARMLLILRGVLESRAGEPLGSSEVIAVASQRTRHPQYR